MNVSYIIYSDLDGTLLNHDDYSFQPAAQALALIQEKSIPLILTTSKTFAEVVTIQQDMGIQGPIIVENGAGIFIPSQCELAKDLPYKEPWIKVSHAASYIELRLFFSKMKRAFPIRGFGDMSVEEVMHHTGLNHSKAIDAKRRDFTEPFIIEDESFIEGLRRRAHVEGLDIIKGGRFYHLVSKDHDKATAMKLLTHMYDEYYDTKHITIALGDSANDFTMLKQANKGVLIPLHDGRFSTDDLEGVMKAKLAGPAGWNIAVQEILNVS